MERMEKMAIVPEQSIEEQAKYLMPAFLDEEGRSALVKAIVDKIVRLYSERPSVITVIKNRRTQEEVPEITRPLALELLRMIYSTISLAGGSYQENVEVLHAGGESVIVKASIKITLGDKVLEFVEIGEGNYREEDDETPARRAYTRAMKRLIEKILGEDFINRLLLSLIDNPASENQKNLIRRLVNEKKLTKEIISQLIQSGKLPKDFSLNQALTENTLTKRQANAIISAVLSREEQEQRPRERGRTQDD
ncbi:MAG: hypothetical protein QW251_04090 [Desulfurococcaceae archaeon]